MEYMIGLVMLVVVLFIFVIMCNRNNKRYDKQVQEEFAELNDFHKNFVWNPEQSRYERRVNP